MDGDTLSVTKEGLSPRLRGNPFSSALTQDYWRSIPAPAGEPKARPQPQSVHAVYPRACGGTVGVPEMRPALPGLSPRLRGNRTRRTCHSSPIRSIPAPAGEPVVDWRRVGRQRVYPRACGGTLRVCSVPSAANGLSPRLRGNRAVARCQPCQRRSIPAPAGEPRRCAHSRCTEWVYPRACGGTIERRWKDQIEDGLSPRLRGNRSGFASPSLSGRSIPAPAGEPAHISPLRSLCTVYPRACGGTRCRGRVGGDTGGLSPRLRGNLVLFPHTTQGRGSIPAPAGEPLIVVGATCGQGVYPRACGGTVAMFHCHP